jgi:hypothetical protein
MFGNRTTKLILEGCLGGGRPARKPKNRYGDEERRDGAIFHDIKNGRTTSSYRSEKRKKQRRPWLGNGPKRSR